MEKNLAPTIGGILLFGLEREIHFSDAWIQCGRFAGKTKDVITKLKFLKNVKRKARLLI